MIELLLGGVYTDLRMIDPTSGLSTWLQACIVAQPTILRMLLSAGCDIGETHKSLPKRINKEGYISGWNCLFFVVLHASTPESSDEFESLRFLLDAGANPFLRDADDKSIFDYVNEDTDYKFARYQRDLWYSTLHWCHVEVGHYTKQTSELEVYSEWYTPIHYRALHSLETWNKSDLEFQVSGVV
jgi:hypothetical protein